jgi:subtilisin family serine protease
VRWLTVVAFVTTLVTVVAVQADTAQTYVVLYKSQVVPNDAASVIARAGGVLVASYDQIGVVIARSGSATFSANMLKDGRVEGAVATELFGSRPGLEVDSLDVAPTAIPSPVAATDSLTGLQWDMVQMHAFDAHAITGGSSRILVGNIDTGIDFTHPDLAPNIDFANSVSCLGGVPNQDPAAWNDEQGHGTHTAGTIAAAQNGIGIVGVAPNVRIAAIRAGNADGVFLPEAVICAFMWAANHSMHVTNNSYFVDPWLYNCRNDATQRAIWKATRRAIRYALSKGVVVVSATGNAADDLAHPTLDATSPTDTPVLRSIRNDCAVVPVEVPGVIGVSANGNLGLKSQYSNYGVGTTQVVAPGGDAILQRTPAAPNGQVLSTWPAALLTECRASQVDSSGATYCYLQGTSMASPHVAGVAALIASQRIRPPGAIAARISNTADPIACPPDLSIYDSFPSENSGAPQVCQGGAGYNSFNGHGQVNALRAVTQ